MINSVFELSQFIHAIRDIGYRSLSWALAELIDNSIEAYASKIYIQPNNANRIIVCDNGKGMGQSTLETSLQFGGSTRFGSRTGTGRFGMGLPCSPLSQARRIDIYSWTNPKDVWQIFLDLDDLSTVKSKARPARFDQLRLLGLAELSNSGTVIVLSKCDRVDVDHIDRIRNNLIDDFGRIFRKFIWDSRIKIIVDNQVVEPIDPLFLRKGKNLIGGKLYGSPFSYKVYANNRNDKFIGTVKVAFVELPIMQWHSYSDREKNKLGISRKAGISILRADREIDYGWFFLENKRKENYDDWWRCEISFDPVLDELFGVSISKQGIRPTRVIADVLGSDIEQTARCLNSRVKRTYSDIKNSKKIYLNQASRRDFLLEPPNILHLNKKIPIPRNDKQNRRRREQQNVIGLRYQMCHKVLEEDSFYVPVMSEREMIVILNEDHPFFSKIYLPIYSAPKSTRKFLQHTIEVIIFAAARAELDLHKYKGAFRKSWSDILGSFLG